MTEQWHYNQNTKISGIAGKMAELFIAGHNVQQTPEYEETRQEYLRQQVIKGWHDVGIIPPPEHIVG